MAINNHKTLIALASISAIAAVLTGSAVHLPLADTSTTTITKTTTNSGVNVQTDTNQKQNCETAGGSSPISMSCTAASSDTVSQSGGVKK
jgi:hypothetical protein